MGVYYEELSPAGDLSFTFRRHGLHYWRSWIGASQGQFAAQELRALQKVGHVCATRETNGTFSSFKIGLSEACRYGFAVGRARRVVVNSRNA